MQPLILHTLKLLSPCSQNKLNLLSGKSTGCESLGELKKNCGNTHLSTPTAFLPNFHLCFYLTIMSSRFLWGYSWWGHTLNQLLVSPHRYLEPEKGSFEGKYASFNNINFQGATIRPMVTSYKHSPDFIVHH